jgi:hypothetical protein
VEQKVKIETIITETCASVLACGELSWAEIRAAIGREIASLSVDDRQALENELRLMVSRPEDQQHEVVAH